ncbi:MAG: CHAT domain-containing protein [Cyclobacteriaceae bacterium]|nr:CHAT domain-containing protein [Cyclobacteriaceae bacterium]
MKNLWLFLIISSIGAYNSAAQTAEVYYIRLDSLNKAKNFEQIATFEGALQPLLANRTDTLKAAIYDILGFAFFNLGEDLKAINYMEQQRALRQAANQTFTKNYSNLLYNLTYINNLAGRYTQARAAGDELIVIDKRLYGESSPEYAASVTFVLDVLINQGSLTKAKELAAATLKSLPKKDSLYAMTLNKYADIHQLTGEYSRSEKLFKESLRLLRGEGGEARLNFQNASVNLGNLYVAEGRIPEAEKIFSSALSFYQPRQTDPAAEAAYFSTLNNRALALQSLSLYGDAISIYTELLRHDSVAYGTDHPFYATTLNNLADVLVSRGDLEQARRLFRRSLAISIATYGAQSADAATVYNNLANTYRLNTEYDSALALYRRASDIFLKESGAESAEYATSLMNIGKALLGKNSPEAKSYLLKALKLRKKQLGVKHPRYGEILQKLSFYYWKTNDKEAFAYFKMLLDNYYAQIQTYFPILSEEEKSKFYFSKFKVDQEAFISFILDKAKSDANQLAAIYDLALNTKGLLFYASQKVRMAILQSNNDALINKYETWISIKEQIAKANAETDDKESLRKTDSLFALSNRLEKELTLQSAEFKNVFSTTRYSWQEVQKKLQPGEAAVEVIRYRAFSPNEEGYFTGKVNYLALVLTKETTNGPRLVTWTNGGELEGRYLNFYRNTTRFLMGDTITFSQYWRPLATTLKGIKKVYYCPDGVFNQINMGTLYNPESKKFLSDEIEIDIMTNTKDLLTPKKSVKSGSGAHLFGFPDYRSLEMDGPAVSTDRSTRALSRSLRFGLLRSFFRGDGVPPLPGTKTEVENIAHELTAKNRKNATYFEKRANEFEIKKIKNPTILHIATHGFFLDDEDLFTGSVNQSRFLDNPLFLSGLIIASKNSDASNEAEDGILTAYEAMNMTLDSTELVVLSACETGLGTIKNGEGIYGLQRSFRIAGAECLIMSLWKVDDDATQLLMSNFYNYLMMGDNKRTAFVKAQRKVREKNSDRFFWGAFVMVGN